MNCPELEVELEPGGGRRVLVCGQDLEKVSGS
jgi:hypothetical protein